MIVMNRLVLALSALGVVITPAPVLAVRVISIAVEQNGKTVLIGSDFDDGRPRPYTVWRYVMTCPLRPAPGLKVQPEPGRPLEAVLRGKILVSVTYGANVEASELKLTRRREGREEWLIDRSWVERNGPPGDPAVEEPRFRNDRSNVQSEREACLQRESYPRGSLVAAGAAAVSWGASLTALVLLLLGKRRPVLGWVCLTALVSCGLVVAWNFIGGPYSPDDEQSHDRRSYAVYAGVVSGALAVITWLTGHWRRGPAEQKAAPDRGRM